MKKKNEKAKDRSKINEEEENCKNMKRINEGKIFTERKRPRSTTKDLDDKKKHVN